MSQITISSPASGELNPFMIPEILFVLGRYLPLWKKPHGYACEFDPTTFLACLQVCKLWRFTLIAHLWLVYEHNTMFWVPPEVRIKNSSFFRITDNWEIITITARSEQKDVAPRNNTDLKQLTLNNVDSDRDTPMSTQTADEIASLQSLQSLKLVNWTMETSAFENHLFRNKLQLKTMILNRCRYKKAPLAAPGHEEDPMSGFPTLRAIPTICPNLQTIILTPDRTPVQQAKEDPVSELDTYEWAARLILGLTYTGNHQVRLRCGLQALDKVRAGMIKLKAPRRSIWFFKFERRDTDVEDTIEIVLKE